MFKQGTPLRKSSTSESHVGSRVRRFVRVLWRHSPSWSHWCLYICLCLCLLPLYFCLCLLYLSLSEWERFCFTCSTLTYGSLVPLLAIKLVFEALSLYYSYSNDARDVPLVILWQNLSIGRSPVALWMLRTSRMYGALAIFGFDFFDLWWKLSEISRWLDYVRSLHLKIVFAISIEGSLASILKTCLCSRHPTLFGTNLRDLKKSSRQTALIRLFGFVCCNGVQCLWEKTPQPYHKRQLFADRISDNIFTKPTVLLTL